MALTGEAKLEAQRIRRMKPHEAPCEAPEAPIEAPETKLPSEGLQAMKPLSEAPDNQGVDGWHTTDKGISYILQDTGMGGHCRLYRPGPRMFSYR